MNVNSFFFHVVIQHTQCIDDIVCPFTRWLNIHSAIFMYIAEATELKLGQKEEFRTSCPDEIRSSLLMNMGP